MQHLVMVVLDVWQHVFDSLYWDMPHMDAVSIINTVCSSIGY